MPCSPSHCQTPEWPRSPSRWVRQHSTAAQSFLETLPALAVSVTASAVVTDDTVAVNPALLALAGTTTVAGTVTAPLLLVRPTLRPPLPAAAVSVTVQASLPDPVIDALLQDNALSAAGTAVPVPVRLITAVPLVDEVLWMVN